MKVAKYILENPESHVQDILSFTYELTDDRSFACSMAVRIARDLALTLVDTDGEDIAQKYTARVLPILQDMISTEMEDKGEGINSLNSVEDRQENKPRVIYKNGRTKPKEIKPHPNKERFEELMRKVAEMGEED